MGTRNLLEYLREVQGTLAAIEVHLPGKRLPSYGVPELDSLIRAINGLLDRIESSEARDRTILESMEDGYFELDGEGRIVFTNSAFDKMLGYPAPDLKGKTLGTLQNQQEHHIGIVASVTETEAGAPASTWLTRGDGKIGYFEARIGRISGAAEQLVGYRGILHDVSAHVLHQQVLHEMVYRDALTGLANRKAFYRDLNTALSNGGLPLTLAFIDLDRFKQVNDTYGHDVGDSLLECISERLRNLLRSSDKAYRLGGDEFTVICPGTDGTAANALFERLLIALSEPVAVDGVLVDFVTPSIGFAIAPDHANTTETLLKCADEAMYEAKQQRGCLRVYRPPP